MLLFFKVFVVFFMLFKRLIIYYFLYYLIINNVYNLNLILNMFVLNNINVEIFWIYFFIIREKIVGYEYVEFFLYVFGKFDIFFLDVLFIINCLLWLIYLYFIVEFNIVDIFWVLFEFSIFFLFLFIVDKRFFFEYY